MVVIGTIKLRLNYITFSVGTPCLKNVLLAMTLTYTVHELILIIFGRNTENTGKQKSLFHLT